MANYYLSYTGEELDALFESLATLIDADLETEVAKISATPITEITTSTTLAVAHKGTLLKCNSTSAITITIDLQSNVAYEDDSEYVITQYGTGAVDIAVTAGVTVNSLDSMVAISGQYGSVTLKKIADDEWLLMGALA